MAGTALRVHLRRRLVVDPGGWEKDLSTAGYYVFWGGAFLEGILRAAVASVKLCVRELVSWTSAMRGPVAMAGNDWEILTGFQERETGRRVIRRGQVTNHSLPKRLPSEALG